MNAARKKKLMMVFLILGVVSVVTALVLYALRQNISLFYSPTQIARGEAPTHHAIRVGGMVVSGSVLRDAKDLSVHFAVTDYSHTLVITYKGILPDLFRERQGIVAEGMLLDDHQFIATTVLAKHDENYMPPEVKDALARAKKEKVKSHL